MAIKLLDELAERLVAVGAAGVRTAEEDFRLRELTARLAPLAQRAQVFQTIQDLLNKLAGEDDKSAYYLEAVDLVRAVRVIQADAEAQPGSPVKPALNSCHIPTLTASEAAPILAALTSSGSGRLEVIKDAARCGILQDHRFARALAVGMRDAYGEIAELCGQVVASLGSAMHAALKAEFDPNGAKADARILHALSYAAQKEENDLYLRLAESAKGAMREEAILALCWDTQNEPYLRKMAEGKRSRPFYLAALMAMPSESAMRYAWEAYTKEMSDIYMQALDNRPDKSVFVFFAARLSELLDGIAPDRPDPDPETCSRIVLILHLFESFPDPAGVAVCHRAVERLEELGKCKLDLRYFWKGVMHMDNDIVDKCATILAKCDIPEENEFLISRYRETKSPFLTLNVLLAWLHAHGGDGLYDVLKAELTSAKSENADAIATLLRIGMDPERPADCFLHSIPQPQLVSCLESDRRWLEFFMERGEVEGVLRLAKKGDKVEKFFDREYNEKKKSGDDYRSAAWSMAAKLLEMESPHAEDFILTAIRDGKWFDMLGTKYETVIGKLGKEWKQKLLQAAEKGEKHVQQYSYAENFFAFVKRYAESL